MALASKNTTNIYAEKMKHMTMEKTRLNWQAHECFYVRPNACKHLSCVRRRVWVSCCRPDWPHNTSNSRSLNSNPLQSQVTNCELNSYMLCKLRDIVYTSKRNSRKRYDEVTSVTRRAERAPLWELQSTTTKSRIAWDIRLQEMQGNKKRRRRRGYEIIMMKPTIYKDVEINEDGRTDLSMMQNWKIENVKC